MNSTPQVTLKRNRLIAFWLLAVCVMVYGMVVLGGVTRLTHSGLSMVEWKPVTGWLPPLNEDQWQEAFAKYQQFPEYKKVNAGMTREDFKSIFWLEFLHRLWGRCIGLAFFAPFVFFLLKGWVDRPLGWKLALMFVLGGLQGVLGWYMVKSGLSDRPDVSQYRLTAHLGAALVVYGYMLWVALRLLWPDPLPKPAVGVGKIPLGRFAGLLAALIFVTALSGGFVAGLDAGYSYNTFPLMDGALIPEGLFDLQPFYLNFFENIATVQFDHRLLAETILILSVIFWLRARKEVSLPRARLAVNLSVFAALAQAALGISTLLLQMPTPLAAAHQAGAVALFTMTLWAAHELRAG